MSEKQKLFSVFLGLNLLLAACCTAFYALIKAPTALPGAVDICPWTAVFHIYCPGCGGSRAFVALLHGRFLRSMILHPGVILAAALVLYYEVRGLGALVSGDTARFFGRVKHRLIIAYAIFILIYAVVRNLLLRYGIDPIGDLGIFYR